MPWVESAGCDTESASKSTVDAQELPMWCLPVDKTDLLFIAVLTLTLTHSHYHPLQDILHRLHIHGRQTLSLSIQGQQKPRHSLGMSLENGLPPAAVPTSSTSTTPGANTTADADHNHSITSPLAPIAEAHEARSNNGSDGGSSDTILVPEPSSVAIESDSSGSMPLVWSLRPAAHTSRRPPVSSNGTILLVAPPNSRQSNEQSTAPGTNGTLNSIPQPAAPPGQREHSNDARNSGGEAASSQTTIQENEDMANARFGVPLFRPRPIYPLSGREGRTSARRRLEYRVMQWNEASERVG